MVEAKSDKSKNLLKISYSGEVHPDELKIGAERIKMILSDLQPGFWLLTDLSKLELMDVACAVHIKRVMDWCNKKGLSKVVRVIPDPHKDIGLSIMSLFHYRRRVHIVTCETLQEAMTGLEG